MDTDRTGNFRHARRFERDLNERQREVLAGMAKGQTNAEIAAALDMTFDGAKWNVSEILSKLGLSSREEAAEYWHWRQGIGSRAKSALRALVPAGLPMKLVAGGGFAAAVTVAVLVFGLLNAGPESEMSGYRPYRMTMISGSRSDRDGAGGYMVEERLDDFHARHTTITPAYGDDPGETVVMVADGENLWMNSSSMPEYNRASLEEVMGAGTTSARSSFFLGPTRLSSVDDVLDALRNPPPESGLDTPRHAEVVGQDTLLGIPVVIIEYREGDGRTTRIWIDTATMFVLKYDFGPIDTSDPDDIYLTGEVTSIEYDPEFEPGTFTFVPPPGKSLVEATPVAP